MNVKSNPEQAGYVGNDAVQVQHWDNWNSKYRQPETIDAPSKRRMKEVLDALSRLRIHGAHILEIGCGTGWLSEKLTEYGTVTAVDLAAEVIQAAKAKTPQIDFRSGDAMELELPINYFDLIVTLETFSHVSSQKKFVARMAELLKADGNLLLTTQNKFVFDRRSGVVQNPSYIRQWVTMKTLRRIVDTKFRIVSAISLEPEGHLGVLRFVNSHKLNRIIAYILGAERLKQFKENMNLGQTLFITAVKR